MAIKTDISRAKKRSQEAKEQAARYAQMGRQSLFWTPKQGTNIVRVLPPWTTKGRNKNLFWRELWVHFGVVAPGSIDDDSRFTVLCNAKTEDAAEALGYDPATKLSCGVCDMLAELKATGNPADEETVKNMRAKMRIYSNIIDMNDPIWTKDAVLEQAAKGISEENLPKVGDPKVQVFTYGAQIFDQILDYFNDDIDLSDLANGKDIKIERTGKDKQSTKYRVRTVENRSHAPIKDSQLAALLYDLDNIMSFMTSEQIDLILQGATKADVFKLQDRSSAKRLAAPAKKKEVEEEEEETEEPVEEVEEEEVAEEPAEEEVEAAEEPAEEEVEAAEESPIEYADATIVDPDNIPLLPDKQINYKKLTDEQIENKANVGAVALAGTDSEHSVYVECFGAAMEYDDKTCSEECIFYENGRCKARVEQIKAIEEAKKNPPRRAGRPKKEAAPPPPPPPPPPKIGKKKKDNGESKQSASEAAKAVSGIEELQARMKAALNK